MLKKLDLKVQKYVDTVAFWLMRRGVPLSWQHYMVSALYIVSCLGSALVDYSDDADGALFGLVFMVGLAPILIFFNEVSRRRREADEAAGGLASDLLLNSWIAPFKLVSLLLLAMLPWSPRSGASIAMDATADVALLLTAYLMRTPLRPPPRREPRTVAVPSPVPLT